MEHIQNPPVLEVRDLSVSFQMQDGIFGQKMLQVISELNIKVHAGEILHCGIVWFREKPARIRGIRNPARECSGFRGGAL